MQFSTYQPVDLIFKLIVPENISIPRQAPKAFGAAKTRAIVVSKPFAVLFMAPKALAPV